MSGFLRRFFLWPLAWAMAGWYFLTKGPKDDEGQHDAPEHDDET